MSARKLAVATDRSKKPISTDAVWHKSRRPMKMSDKLARQIVDDILAKGLRCGCMLPTEAEMTRDYSVSRGTLREALRLLEVQGIITIKPGPRGGPMIADPEPADFARMMRFYLRMRGATYREVLGARLAIEPMMARLAADAQDEKGIAELRRVIALCEQADPSNEAEWLSTSHLFHATIAGISGNAVLDLLGMSLKDVYHSWALTSLAPLKLRAKVLSVHRAIADAILGGKGLEAERLMADHMMFYAEQSGKVHAASLDDRIEWG